MKNKLNFLLWSFLFLVFSCQEAKKFNEVWVIGASISSDGLGRQKGPVKLAAEKLMIKNYQSFAVPGKSSRYFWPSLKDKVSGQTPDLIFALDLFFHDAAHAKTINKERLDHIQSLLNWFCTIESVIIISKVFSHKIRENHRPSLEINKILEQKASTCDNILLLAGDEFYKDLYADGYRYTLGQKNVLYRQDELLRDLLHPTETGSKVMANMIINLLNETIMREGPIEFIDLED